MAAGSENKFKNTSLKIKRIRYIIALVLVVFVIFAVFSYREDLTVENFRYLMKFVDVKPLTFGSAENAQINFDSDSSTVTGSFKEDLVTVSKTAVKIYDLSSKQILDSPVSLMKPALAVGDKYFAVFDIGSGYLGIYNSFSKLWEKTFSYPVLDVALDSKGNFSVITAEKGYTSALKVYNDDFENIFNWRTADKYAVTSDIMTDSDMFLLVGTVRSNTSGDAVSSVFLLSDSSKKPLVSLDFEGELMVDTSFNGEGNAVVLTDRALRFINRSGKVLSEFFFNSSELRKFEVGETYTALVLNEKLVGKDHKVFIFDANGDTYIQKEVVSEITDVALSDSFAFILGVEDITVFDIKSKKTKSYPSERSYRSVHLFDKKNVYLVYDSLAVALGVE